VAANWTPANVPGSGVDTCLPSGSYTVTVPSGLSAVGTLQIGSSGAASEPTLELSASHTTGNVELFASSDLGNFGTIELTDPDPSGTASATAELELTAGTLTNDGTIETIGTAGVSGLDGDLTNDADGTIGVGQDTQVEASEPDTFSTDGTVDISAGDALLVGCDASNGCEPSTLEITGGTITNHGSFLQAVTLSGLVSAGTLNLSGGTIDGGPLVAGGSRADHVGHHDRQADARGRGHARREHRRW
jgi:hypothetical protein